MKTQEKKNARKVAESEPEGSKREREREREFVKG